MTSMCSIQWPIVMFLSFFVTSALKTDFLDSASAPASGKHTPSTRTGVSTWHWTSLSSGLPTIESVTILGRRQVKDPWHMQKAEPMSINFIRNLHGEAYYSSITQAMLIILVVVGLISGFIVLLQSDVRDPSSAAPNGMTVRQRIKASPPLSTDDLQFAMEGCDGSWARMYKRVPMNELESLELLFRCGLVPVQDFDISSVPKDHIDECIGIAKSMLNDKPLDDWVESWAEAIQVFEESKTARHSVKDDYDLSEERISDMVIGIAPQLHPQDTSIHLTSPPSSVYSGLDAREKQDIRQSVPPFGRSSAMPSNSNTDPALLSRCREIMSQYQPRSRKDNDIMTVGGQSQSVPATVRETEEEHIVGGDQGKGAALQTYGKQLSDPPSARVCLQSYERFPTDTQISSSSGQIYTGSLTYDASQRVASEEIIMDGKGGKGSARSPASMHMLSQPQLP